MLPPDLPPSVLCPPLQALDYAGGFGKTLLLPHLVEQETLQEDGSVLRRLERTAWVC